MILLAALAIAGGADRTPGHAAVGPKAAAAAAAVAAVTATSAPGKGLWVWGTYSPLTNQSTSDAFFRWAAAETAQPVRTIFLEDEGLANGDQSTAAFERFLGTLDHTSSGRTTITAAPLYGWYMNMFEFFFAWLDVNPFHSCSGDVPPRTRRATGSSWWPRVPPADWCGCNAGPVLSTPL